MIKLVMPGHPLEEHFVGHLERVEDARLLIGDGQQTVVGNDNQRVDLLLQSLNAGVGLHGPAATLEGERSGDHADRQRSEATGDLGDHRCRARSGAATLAGGDEDHVGALDHLFDLFGVRLGGVATDLGIAAGAETAGEVASDVELEIGVAHQQRLRIGVDGDELHALQSGIDHPVDGVDTATADPHDLDDGEIVLGRADHQRDLPVVGSMRMRFIGFDQLRRGRRACRMSSSHVVTCGGGISIGRAINGRSCPRSRRRSARSQ